MTTETVTPPVARRFANGLSAAAEECPSAKTIAFGFLFPGGAAADPPDAEGIAALLDEAMLRGAGDMDAKAFLSRLDGLGVLHSTDLGRDAWSVTAVAAPEVWTEALSLFRTAFEAPRIEENDLAAAKDLARAALDRLADEPAARAIEETARRHYPAPLSRSPYGTAETIERATRDDLLRAASERFVPDGAFFAVSGPAPAEALLEAAEKVLGTWRGAGRIERPEPEGGAPAGTALHRIPDDGAQCQIVFAARWVAPDDPDEPAARVAVQALSGGMGSRLFIEVREKRGLVYAVRASYSSLARRGDLFAYAGTTPPREEETRTVLEAEIRRLSEGLAPDEFERARFSIRSRIAMELQSPSARAARLLSDAYRRGRVRSVDERLADFAALDLSRTNAFLAARPPGPFTRLVLGPGR